MSAPDVSQVSRNDVLRVTHRDFPGESPEVVLAILDEYADHERDRVQLAILKLSGGQIDELLNYAGAAIQDYRDVIAWAEYRRYFDSGLVVGDQINSETIRRLQDEDRDEYLRWLRRE
jgi:hypothetical protein